MTLHVLGSSSKGNCYLLTDKQGQTLVVEAGIKYEHISRKLDFKDYNIVGAVVSHCHGDHAKYVHYLLAAGVETYAHESVFTEKQKRNPFANYNTEFKAWIETIGRFKVTFLPVEHDVPCFAFYIRHPEGDVFFITDTMYCGHNGSSYLLPECKLAMLECNYDDETLAKSIESGVTEEAVADRTRLSHMEFRTTKEIIRQKQVKVDNILLIHLSEHNSNPERYVKEIQSESAIPTYIAKKGFELNF